MEEHTLKTMFWESPKGCSGGIGRAGGVALCAREKLDFTALTLRDDAVESLMVSSWGMENKANVLVGVSYQSLLSRGSWV